MALSLRKNDQDAQWFDFDDETQVLVARQDNQKYTIGLQRLRTFFAEKRNRFLSSIQDKNGNLQYGDAMFEVDDDEKAELDAQADLMARHLLLDMRTVGRSDGKVVIDDEAHQYTHDLGSQLIAGNPELFVFVIEKARSQQREAAEVADRVEKKPANGSAGKSSGVAKKGARQTKPTQRSASS